MPRTVITKKAEKYIRENYKSVSISSMAKHLEVGKTAVGRFMKLNRLKVSRKKKLEFRYQGIRDRYDSIEHPLDEVIKSNYLLIPEKRLAEQIGKSDTYVRGRLKKLGLKIPKRIIEQRKKDSQIKPGSIPPNKGVKQRDYMSPEAIEKTKGTRFKKGNLPHNTKEKDGVITIRHDHPDRKGGRTYKYIRISLGKWKLYHIHVWEKKNGKIPPGHCLWFKDGDSLNCKLSNLELITRRENLKRNSGSTNLSNAYIAGLITHNDPELRKKLLESGSPIIELKRKQIQLKRKIDAKQKNNNQA